MQLFHRDYGGEGLPPLIVLHGFLGSSRNWASAAKRLSEFAHPYALDLPNHGQSPLHSRAPVPVMAAAVLEWLDQQGMETASVAGHSLGGKVAMRLAVDHPQRVERLLVLDIAPRAYPLDTRIVDAMMALEPSDLRTRGDADRALAAVIPNASARLFVLTNLVGTEAGDDFVWQVDPALLREELAAWVENPLRPDQRYDGPTKFIVGGSSSYFQPGDFELARVHFPQAELDIIAGSGHNVHVEGGDRFTGSVRSFMIEGDSHA